MAQRQFKRKRIAAVRFANGARFEAYLLDKAVGIADPSDRVEIRITASADYGEGADEPLH